MQTQTITPQSYEGVKMLTWLGSDINLVQEWSGNIFAGGADSSDPNFKKLIDAALQSVVEAQDDLVQIVKILNQYLI